MLIMHIWIAAKLSILLQILYFYNSCGGAKTNTNLIDSLVEESLKKRPAVNLTCHVCHSDQQQYCINITDYLYEDFYGYPQMCSTNATICQVKKFSITITNENGTSPHRVFAVKRECSSKCIPGCVIMGERNRIHVCSSCCTESLCNTMSGTNSLRLLTGKKRNNFLHLSFYFFVSIILHSRPLLFS